MANIRYLDKEPTIRYTDEPQGALSGPEFDAMGNEVIRRGKAAAGGIEGAASMLSQLPSMLGGGIAGGATGLVTGDWDAAASVMQDVSDKIPYYKPQSEAGQDFQKMFEHAREWTGDMGGITGDVSPGIRAVNEMGFDIATGLIPLGPTVRGRGRTATEKRGAVEAMDAKNKAPAPEPTIRYTEPVQGELNLQQPVQGPDLGAMMERAQERTFHEPLQQQVEAAGPQADMFNDRGGQFPGTERVAEAARQKEMVPYEELSLADEGQAPRQPGFEFGKQGEMDFPLRQEVLDSPEVKQIIDSYRTEHARMLEEGAPPSAIAQLEQGFGEYMQKFGVKGPEDATGLRRPLYESGQDFQLGVAKTDRPALGKPAGWSEHSPTPFELSDGPIQLSIERALNKQAGVFNPGVFVEGFNRAKIALGNAVKLTAFTNRDMSALPPDVKQWAKVNTNHHLDAWGPLGPIFRIVAHDPRNNKPFGILELRRKGDFLEADWVHVEPAYRGLGLATEAYTFARELGNDIRASQVRTPEGKKMWEAHLKAGRAQIDPKTGRPYLPKIDQPIRGPKSQEGAIGFKKDPEFEKFKSELPEYFKKDAKAMYKEYKKLQAEKPVMQDEGAREAMSNIPGVKNLLDEYNENFKTVEEMAETFTASPDISGSIVGKTLTYGVLSGGDFVGRVFNSPMVKWGAHKVRSAQRDIGRQIAEVLYDKDSGLVPLWQDLSKADKTEWGKLVIENEGVRELGREELAAKGYSPKVVDFYLRTRDKLNNMFDYGNQIRTMMGYKPIDKRAGYFPAKFIGDFYVTITKTDEATGMKQIVGLYAGDSLKEVKGFQKKLTEMHEGTYEVSQIIEKSRGHHSEGYAHAYGVYSDLMNMVQSKSPDAQVLQRLIDEYQQDSLKKTAGFFQHQKFKRGIEGSTGRNQFRDELKNADDMMRSLQGYTHQLYEYGEFSKIGRDFRSLLDKNKFPDKENTQSYLRWYFDQARGAESRFAQLQNDVIDYMAHRLGFGGSKLRVAGGVARSYLTWNLLSGHNAKFVLQQLVQPSQFLAQNLTSLRSKGVDFTPGQMMDAWASGWKDSIDYRLGRAPEILTQDLNWAAKNHVFDQSVMHDLDNLITDKGVNLWTMLNGNHTIRLTEQFGRMQVFITFNKLLDGKLDSAKRRELAADLTTSLMTDYRPFEMPAMYRMAGPIGTAASSLSRYKHNFFSQLIDFTADYVRSGGSIEKLQPILLVLGVNTTLAGLMGLPGREDFDFLLNILKDFDAVDMNVTQTILASKNPNYVSHGLISSLTGSDLSASLSPGAALPREHSLMPLVSKGKAVIEAAAKFASTRTNATGFEFLKEVLPVSGLAQAPLEYFAKEGNVIMGKDNQGVVRRDSDAAWIKRLLSMRDLDEAKERTATFEIKKDEDRRKGRVEKLIDRAYEDAMAGKNVLQIYREDMQKLNMLPPDLIDGIKRIHKNRMTTEAERFGGTPPTSQQQIRKQMELQKYRP